MLKLTPTKKFFITIILFVLVIAGVLGAYIWMYGHVRALASKLGSLDFEITSGHKQQQQIGSLASLLRDHHADFERVGALAISRANPAPFFREFEALAARTNTTIAINLNNGETEGDTMILQFIIEGAEENVAAVLALIEHAPYELTMNDISMQRNSTGQSSAVHLLISITAKTSL